MVYLTAAYTNQRDRLRPVACRAFMKMADAAAQEGLRIYNASAYRSYTTQKWVYQRYVNQEGTQEADTYSLVLVDPRKNLTAAFDALAWLSRRPWCAPEFPICRRSQEELEALLFRAPVSLMWGLSAQRASEALAAFRAPGMAAVYRDSDGSSAEGLVQKPQVPPQSLPSPQPSRTPMSFGATVGAVFLGVLAAVLVLSLF